ncbi:hypothetical protein IFM89_031062 [Coptis chinensis]|uniref:Carbonic anhydrase n=1 Tax=Coptis chinensis TaxID=261450 RepID=A0A835LH22_9MAGN|nr:hypothetical protein IFM89_031062 [Coptis chinensis]
METRFKIFITGFVSLFLVTFAEDLKFSYSGPTGPEKWGSMSPSFFACSSGKAQSPMQIIRNAGVLNPNLGPLSIQYSDSSATLINHGFNVELLYGNEVGGAIIDGKQYSLKQMHWHSPSEHKIDGVRYAAELHLVHKSADGSISVVAILYNLGAPDALLSQIEEHFDQLAKEAFAGREGSHIPIKVVKAANILQTTKRYFRYVGSLTTPPCSEKVIWNILEEVRQISSEQLNTLKAPLKGSCKNNFRPTQPSNGRLVEISVASKTSNLLL